MAAFAQQQSRTQSSDLSNPARPDRADSPPASMGNPFMAQQQSLGNQAMQRMLRAEVIQAKLTVTRPGDQYEQEADRVAEAVMRMPDPGPATKEAAVPGQAQSVQIQRMCSECEEELHRQPMEEEGRVFGQVQTPHIQRMCSECEEELHRLPVEGEKEVFQTKGFPDQTAQLTLDVEANINALRGGQPLPQLVRAFFEPRFGRDFSQVRIHADARAADSARMVNARAYTVGSDMVFGAGEYAPETASGRRLLAHELAHVVQQSEVVGGVRRPVLPDRASGEGLEHEAESQAAGPVQVQGRLGIAGLQRQAGISPAPSGLPCDRLVTGAGHPTGTDILFGKDSSALTPSQRASITTFVSSWVAAGSTDDVQVDGYASVEGPQDLNWRLSCNRAESVKAGLAAQGVPAARITTVAHGESTEFSTTDLAPNRRVIISRSAAAPPTPTPPVPVTITGGTELWWFDGETPPGYPVRQTLTASAGGLPGLFTWNIVSGSTFATFSAPLLPFFGLAVAFGSTATLRSIAPSVALNDVQIRVDFLGFGGGTGTASQNFTVQSPERLILLLNDDQTDPSFVYITNIHKKIVDQFGTDLPRSVEVNEQFTAAPTADFPGMDWRRGPSGGGVVGPPGWLFDRIQGETPSHTPTPVPPTDPSAGIKVYHWPGTWQVGSMVIGRGRRVASVTWQKFRGMARHI